MNAGGSPLVFLFEAKNDTNQLWGSRVWALLKIGIGHLKRRGFLFSKRGPPKLVRVLLVSP